MPNEPALFFQNKRTRYLIVGDIHIGRESKLSTNGIHVYGTAELMAKKIISIAESVGVKNIILLGDIKDSIMNPDKSERNQIMQFFIKLEGFNLTVVLGNHDSALPLPKSVKVRKELSIGEIGFIHGHSMPSQKLMGKKYLVAAHDHPAFQLSEFVHQKAWVVCKVDLEVSRRFYKSFNPALILISLPAFNPLIIGGGKSINPLFRRGLFDINKATFYGLSGKFLAGEPNEKTFNL